MHSYNPDLGHPKPSKANQPARLGHTEAPMVQHVLEVGDTSVRKLYQHALRAWQFQQEQLGLEPAVTTQRLSPAVATAALAGHADSTMQYDGATLVQEAQDAVSQAFQAPEGLARANVAQAA